MNLKDRLNPAAPINPARWFAYATAGTATLLVGTGTAEAHITYSGVLNEKLSAPASSSVSAAFPLGHSSSSSGSYFAKSRRRGKKPHGSYGSSSSSSSGSGSYSGSYSSSTSGGSSSSTNAPGNFSLEHIRRGPRRKDGSALFAINGVSSVGMAGFANHANSEDYNYVARLRTGVRVSTQAFLTGASEMDGYLAAGGNYALSHKAKWSKRGVYFVGFKFNNGAGTQYGWAQIKVKGGPENSLKLIDYAYADPGERIKTGQTKSKKKKKKDAPAVVAAPAAASPAIPVQGSLGLLAVGASGLLAWRDRRGQVPR